MAIAAKDVSQSGGQFGAWFLTRKGAWLAVIVTIIWWIVPRLQWSWLSWIEHHESASEYPDVLQAIVILVLLLLWSRRLSRPKMIENAAHRHLEAAARSTTWFYWLWWGLLASWLVFYAIDWFKYSDLAYQPLRNLLNHGLLDWVNTIEAVFFFAIYFEMTAVTFNAEGKRQRSASERSAILLGIFLVLCIVEYFTPPRSIGWWSVVSGLLVGVSMALFIGRCESRFISAPLVLTASAFLYAVLQGAYPLFSGALGGTASGPAVSLFKEVVIMIVLPLKVMLFLLIDWMCSGGKLFFYMVSERRMVDEGGANLQTDWERFWEELEPRPASGVAPAS
ncbi:MAG TPA: hypothetical protein VHT92_10750 [Candidatus Cybelea sp.]|jgi:hypothetical protein|nr:hypothetical protein [Candidatus Cybelea sp.]